MARDKYDASRGFDALRAAVLQCLDPRSALPMVGAPIGLASTTGIVFSESIVGIDSHPDTSPDSNHDLLHPSAGGPGRYDDANLATSSEEDEGDRERLIALVELARKGDKEAFGLLYDHYHGSVFRFLYYRTRTTTLAEDLTSETFFRALRSMNSFRWQGKDFGAWLMTIARNLTMDHFKAGRTRLEQATEDMGVHDDATEGPETAVLNSLTNELLLAALKKLPAEQQDCLVMRFLQGMSIAETALVLDRSEGAVKQLQLRGVRNLAKLMPEGIRD
ncbi:MAG TPA: sigma-70 family RNA polymerase sigma factor [Nocardioides sp.]|jgi:RNA polymerase sigma-70 factor (ECF subfamily)